MRERVSCGSRKEVRPGHSPTLPACIITDTWRSQWSPAFLEQKRLAFILASQAHRGENGWRGLVNVPVIVILLSLILNFTLNGKQLPEWILGAFRMLGASAIPMALLLTGATMSDFLAEARDSRSGSATMVGACVLRLGLLPFVFLVMARCLPCSTELKQVLVVQSAMPCAMLPIVLSKHYGGDAGMAVRIVFATTVLALFTIPYWIHFGMRFLGL